MPAETALPSPKLKAPAHSCDTHIHLYDPAFPVVSTAISKPPMLGAAEYRAVQRRLGLERAVVVQPSHYGTDNRCTLEGVAALGLDRSRGIAVVTDTTPHEELAALTRGGIRGARFLMLPGGVVPWDQLDTIAARVQEHGWHVQLQMDGRLLPERERQIRSWPGTIVVDHGGRFMGPVGVEDPPFRCLLGLIETGRVWVKLSAPYESRGVAGPPFYDDVGARAKALAAAAPERMLWASNWPHPGQSGLPDDSVFLDLLLDWVADEATRRRILVDNPAALYGF